MSLQIMCPVTEKDIQEHVRLRLEAERKEKELRKKEKLEAHLFTVVKLVRDSDIAEQIGSVRWFDLAGTDKVSSPSGWPTPHLLFNNIQERSLKKDYASVEPI